MPRWSIAFVRTVDALNYRMGRFAMSQQFVLTGRTRPKALVTPAFRALKWRSS